MFKPHRICRYLFITYSIKLILEVFVDLSVLKDLIFALPIKYHTLWGMKSFQPQLNDSKLADCVLQNQVARRERREK